MLNNKQECHTNLDCPQGSKCVNGMCVPYQLIMGDQFIVEYQGENFKIILINGS